MTSFSVPAFFNSLTNHPKCLFRFEDIETCNASVVLRSGDILSFGWGSSHYCGNRDETRLSPLEMLFATETLEVALTPWGYADISEVRGWQTPAAISLWIEQLETNLD